jgi:hypothetical protein
VSASFVKLSQPERSAFQPFSTFQLESDLPHLPAQEADVSALTNEPMKSLSELADVYERWATETEARADEILAAQDCYAYEVREHQLWRAEQMRAEAAALKKKPAPISRPANGLVC